MPEMSREDQAIAAIQYLHSEGFIEPFLDDDGDPCIRLTVDLKKARRAVTRMMKGQPPEELDWWQKADKNS